MSKVYAVKVGNRPGIYYTWSDCEEQVKGYKGAVYKSFSSEEDAKNWVYGNNTLKNIDNDSTENLNDSIKLTKAANTLFLNGIISKDLYKEVMLKINNNINNDETIENNIVTEKDTCIIYSDGSYNKSTNKCGYASYIIESNNTKIKCGSFIMEHGGRNVEGEIAAIINTINELTLNKNSNFKNIIIYYDYEGIEKWATGSWNATTIYTQAYAKAMKSIINKFNVKFIHIKSHTGNIGNELVDKIAKLCCDNSLTSADIKFLNNYIKISGFPINLYKANLK